MTKMLLLTIALIVLLSDVVGAFVPFIDGGKEMPAIYKGWFDEQIAKQASTAVGKAISAGKRKIEVNFPPVPNVEEVRFGTPLNQKFGKTVVGKDLSVKGGYMPGSNLSRNLIAYSNMYWAKKIAPALGGGPMGGSKVSILSAEPVYFDEIKNSGVGKTGPLNKRSLNSKSGDDGPLIAVNPGGEETWDRIYNTCGSPPCLIILNNAYSTTYDLGNKRGYEEAYYLKRISKGWVFRAFPGPWQAYLEKPDGKVELLESYRSKPSLKEVATLVREESFRRFAINNDRWFAGRL